MAGHCGRSVKSWRRIWKGDDTVSKLLLHFTYDVDLLEVPERIAAYPRKYQKAFGKWMHNKDNDHGYWVVEDGRKKGVCYGSDAFVEFINTQLLETGEEKAKVIEENLSTYDHDLPMLYF